MTTFAPFQARPLDAAGLLAAQELAAACGVHGIYVGNALADGDGETTALWGSDRLLGCLWFGPRGNLVVLTAADLDADRVAEAVRESLWPWRIALGPRQVVDALARRVAGEPLVHRDQVYYACAPAEARGGERAAGLRTCDRRDRDLLMTATLELNRTDLNVDPRRVDRRWLRTMVEGRIADGSTHVLGPPGQFTCKLDIGSRGPSGSVIEGVFTFPDHRGRGFASALVGAVAAAAPGPMVCLHVAANNRPARAAYERAGMTARDQVRLLLLDG